MGFRSALELLRHPPLHPGRGKTLEVHYVRDTVPIQVDEGPLSIGFEQICEEMELEDEEVKDFVQRQRSRWKELARDPDRVDIVLDKMLAHFLEHPNPSGFKSLTARGGPMA